MGAQKEVKVKIATDEDLSGVEALELRVKQLQKQKIQLNINAKTEQLNNTKSRIEEIKTKLGALEALHPHLGVDVDDSEINALKTELSQLENKAINLELDVETAELEKAKIEVDELDDEEITIQLNNQSAMQGIDQIGQGFDRLKQGASEVGTAMMDLLDSAGKQETNKAFLTHAFQQSGKSAEDAANAYTDISNAVAKLPGDDTVMQGLLSQAVAKDASLTNDELEKMGGAAADYFAAMANYGKPASEAFQDMNNYLLTGNTAEIERSPILANHIDKLKEGTTIQERSALLQQALNEEHWGGMSQQDTYNNKLETFNGMLERGRYNLGGMFQEGAKQAMDWVMKLDEGTNGLVGMGLAALSFASPAFSMVSGLSQIAMGMKAIKDLGFIKWLKEFELAQKLSTAATKIQTAWNWLLNSSFLANPIVLVVIALIALAAAFIWAYQNVGWFREMVDNAWASIVQFAQGIYTSIGSAIQYVSDLFTQFTSQIGLNTDNWLQAILGFILFIPQLPMQVGIALVNTIAKVCGFGDNFVQGLVNAGANAVSGFLNQIRNMYGMVQSEFNRIMGLVSDFITSLPQKVWDLGASVVSSLKGALGIGSPGHMYYMVEGEYNRIDALTKQTNFDTESIGNQMVSDFNPNLTTSNAGGSVGGNTINIEIGTVDNKDRIQEIVKAVEDALKFDNLTAGRGV